MVEKTLIQMLLVEDNYHRMSYNTSNVHYKKHILCQKHDQKSYRDMVHFILLTDSLYIMQYNYTQLGYGKVTISLEIIKN